MFDDVLGSEAGKNKASLVGLLANTQWLLATQCGPFGGGVSLGDQNHPDSPIIPTSPNNTSSTLGLSSHLLKRKYDHLRKLQNYSAVNSEIFGW